MIALNSFRENGDAARDLTPALVRASATLRDGETLVFPEGEWELRPDFARCELLAITNHDYHHRLTALHLAEKDGVTLEGSGCILRASGPVSPLWFEGCRGLTLRNLTLDRKESLNLWGTVIEADEERVMVDLDPARNPPWGAWAGDLFVNIPRWRGRVEVLFEWDAHGRGPVPGSADNLGGWGQHWVYEQTEHNQLMIRGRRNHTPAPGNILMMRTHTRPAPALALSGCDEVVVDAVTMHAAGGMGLIAQRCRDVRVSRCRTAPGPQGSGVYTDLFDATHFANCAGTITLEECSFTGQLDDGTNIHGAYFPVVHREDGHTLLVERRHPQQAGAPVGGPGDQFALCNGETLEDNWTGACAEISDLNPFIARVRFHESLPDSVRVGDALDNLTWQPDAIVRKNIFRHNRARGILLSSRGVMRVEGNTFAVPGAAIHSGGELGFWCESGPVRDLVITRNHFDHCATEPSWGEGVIPELSTQILIIRCTHSLACRRDSPCCQYSIKIFSFLNQRCKQFGQIVGAY